MKIISGKLKGRNLLGPKSSHVRPTSYRAKEMIYSTLNSLLIKMNKSLTNSTVLDCFCGTGALGIEAISRGAKKVFFIDNSEEALKICEENCYKLEIINSVEIINLNLINKDLNNIMLNFDIFFCDPPYGKVSIEDILDKINPKLNSNAIGIIELPKKHQNINFKNLKVLKKKYTANSQFNFILKN